MTNMKSPFKRLIQVLLILLPVLAVILWLFSSGIFNQPPPEEDIGQDTGQPALMEDVIEEPDIARYISGRYLMAGTIVWDRDVEAASRQADGTLDYEYPFRGLPSFSPQDYDAWLADLECPISEEDVPAELGRTTLEFNCLPGFLPFAQQYFKFFNLSNNHSDNSGRDKLEITRDILGEAGIQYFGDPDPSFKEHICEVVALPVKIKSEGLADFETADLPVALCAWHYVFRLPLEGEIEAMREYAEIMPVFAFLHMGAEYQPQADSIQQQLARRVIDAGAEFVIANNPHWVQNAELYEDKLIVYSTGNFIFDQNFDEEVKRSANIIVEVRLDYDDEVARWLDLSPDCAVYQDDCLHMAQTDGLQKLKLNFTFDVVAGYLTNHQQAQAREEIQVWVKQRLNWIDLFVH